MGVGGDRKGGLGQYLKKGGTQYRGDLHKIGAVRTLLSTTDMPDYHSNQKFKESLISNSLI